MTWDGLNKATDQALGYISTWDSHPMADAAYEIIKRRNPPVIVPEAEKHSHTRTKRRTRSEMLKSPLQRPPFVLK